MSGRKRPDIDLVAVADAGSTHDGVEDVVDSTRRPAARAYGRLALASRRPLFRRIAQVVIVLGVGVAVAVAVFRGPRSGSPPTSPLAAAGLRQRAMQRDSHDGRGVARCPGRALGLLHLLHVRPATARRAQCPGVDRGGVHRWRRRANHQRGPGAPCAGWLGIGEHCPGDPAGTEPDGRARRRT